MIEDAVLLLACVVFFFCFGFLIGREIMRRE